MEFRILGPLEVRDNGRVIDVTAAKPRALLAILILSANRVVSTDTLISSLWGERPPETAAKALQVYVSQLRKALGRDRILTRNPGYSLRVEPGELDLDRFEQLITDEQFDDALRLWRENALADFAYEPFAQSEIARLTELRLSCVEARIGADLASGRHADVVGELEGLVRAHPLREHLRGQLMLALYRSGRQAEALDVYMSGRAVLADELGLEPGRELRELQHAILAQDPSLTLFGTTPAAEAPVDVPAAPVPVAREVRKTVTVLSCDLVATGAELDPESLRRMTARGFDALLPSLERRAATVERSLGGAVTAIFGVPTVHEDDALRAVSAAAEMREGLAALQEELVAEWGAALDVRIGVGTGEVLAGRDGDAPYATGAPVAEALRLQHAAAAGAILLDELTHRLARDVVSTELQGDHVRLLGMRSAVGQVRRFDSPMVGRARERRRLDDAFQQATGDRSCQLFTILGAAGVGKSRLVEEFVADLGESALVARGRCLPYGEGITYWPVLEAIRDAADIDDATSDAENLRRLGDVLDGDEEAEVTARRLGEVVGLVEQTSGAEETFRAVRTFVEALARRRPLVLVFDDIHWGESTFLDLVDHLAAWTHDAPILLLCMARPELHEARPLWGGGKLNATAVHLEPLSESESAELVDNLAGTDSLDGVARRHVVDAASGNPLFVEELLALVLEQGGDPAELEIPPTIQALLAARLDRLPDDERTLLEAASVEGKVFHETTAAELASLAQDDVRRHLESLVRKELVRPDRPLFSGERAYIFRHLLIRDAAYEAVPKEVRARLHERYADWLERRVGERTLEFGEIIGYHLEQAFRYRAELGRVDAAGGPELGRRAAELLGAAGRRAFLRSDAPAGANLISRAVALLSPDDPLRVELVPNVRVAQGLDLTWAERVLTEAVEAAATTGDRRLAAHALVQRGLLRLFTDEEVTPAELLDLSERAAAVFESLGDELGLARAWRLASQAHYLDRRPGLTVEVSERALAHAWRAGDRFEEREIVEWLVIGLMLGATPAVEASRRCEQLLGEVSDNPELHAQLHAALAALAAMQGRFDEARASLERSKELMAGLSQWIWIVAIWWGIVFLWQDDIERAEGELRPAYDALGSIGEKSHFSSITHYMSVVAFARGDLGEAERLTVECEYACRANDVHSQILFRSIRAKVFAHTDRVDEAKTLAREAVALAEMGDFLLAHADAVADLGEVLELAGERNAAVDALDEAATLYAEKGVTVEVARARTNSARISAG